MDEGPWIIVRNWERFQHYRDRQPVWIKLYLELAHKDEWRGLSDAQRGLLVGIWMETGLSLGVISTQSIRKVSGKSFRSENLQALVHAGFIQLSASKPLALRYQAASPEVKIKSKTPPTPPRLSRGNRGVGGVEDELRAALLAAARTVAEQWTAGGSDTFEGRLDELEREHGGQLSHLERADLWDIALARLMRERAGSPW